MKNKTNQKTKNKNNQNKTKSCGKQRSYENEKTQD